MFSFNAINKNSNNQNNNNNNQTAFSDLAFDHKALVYGHLDSRDISSAKRVSKAFNGDLARYLSMPAYRLFLIRQEIYTNLHCRIPESIHLGQSGIAFISNLTQEALTNFHKAAYAVCYHLVEQFSWAYNILLQYKDCSTEAQFLLTQMNYLHYNNKPEDAVQISYQCINNLMQFYDPVDTLAKTDKNASKKLPPQAAILKTKAYYEYRIGKLPEAIQTTGMLCRYYDHTFTDHDHKLEELFIKSDESVQTAKILLMTSCFLTSFTQSYEVLLTDNAKSLFSIKCSVLANRPWIIHQYSGKIAPNKIKKYIVSAVRSKNFTVRSIDTENFVRFIKKTKIAFSKVLQCKTLIDNFLIIEKFPLEKFTEDELVTLNKRVEKNSDLLNKLSEDTTVSFAFLDSKALKKGYITTLQAIKLALTLENANDVNRLNKILLNNKITLTDDACKALHQLRFPKKPSSGKVEDITLGKAKSSIHIENACQLQTFLGNPKKFLVLVKSKIFNVGDSIRYCLNFSEKQAIEFAETFKIIAQNDQIAKYVSEIFHRHEKKEKNIIKNIIKKPRLLARLLESNIFSEKFILENLLYFFDGDEGSIERVCQTFDAPRENPISEKMETAIAKYLLSRKTTKDDFFSNPAVASRLIERGLLDERLIIFLSGYFNSEEVVKKFQDQCGTFVFTTQHYDLIEKLVHYSENKKESPDFFPQLIGKNELPNQVVIQFINNPQIIVALLQSDLVIKGELTQEDAFFCSTQFSNVDEVESFLNNMEKYPHFKSYFSPPNQKFTSEKAFFKNEQDRLTAIIALIHASSKDLERVGNKSLKVDSLVTLLAIYRQCDNTTVSPDLLIKKFGGKKELCKLSNNIRLFIGHYATSPTCQKLSLNQFKEVGISILFQLGSMLPFEVQEKVIDILLDRYKGKIFCPQSNEITEIKNSVISSEQALLNNWKNNNSNNNNNVANSLPFFSTKNHASINNDNNNLERKIDSDDPKNLSRDQLEQEYLRLKAENKRLREENEQLKSQDNSKEEEIRESKRLKRA